MIVRCDWVIDGLGEPAESSSWLTVGAEYPVLELHTEDDGRSWYRILNNDGGSAIWPPQAFSVVDQSVPSNWVTTTDGGGVTLAPASWRVPGFWERFFDVDPVARNTYLDELSIILKDQPTWWRRAQTDPGRAISSERAQIAMDYGQFTISGGGDSDPVALVEAAIASPPSSADGKTVLVLSPHQNNFAMPLLIEQCSSRPLDDREDWEQVSEHPLTVGDSGVLIASPTLDEHRFAVEAGDYFVEISGRGFIAIGWPGTTTPNDTWRIRVWPLEGQTPRPPKTWPGPDAAHE